MAPLFNSKTWHSNRGGKYCSCVGMVVLQFDELNLEMRGALKSNHDSSKVRRSIGSFWCCALHRLLLMSTLLLSKNAAGFRRLYVETSVFIALCETDSFRH